MVRTDSARHLSDPILNPRAPTSASSLRTVSRITAAWTFAYGAYRSYYALGGTFAMHGTPRSMEVWHRVNGFAGVLLFAVALLVMLAIRGWGNPRVRPGLLVFAWIVTVTCVSHALIDMVQRVASLAGVLTIDLPFWRTIDRRGLDLQVLFFNEPWFLVEGLLWAGVAWYGALRDSPRRRWWVASATAAIVVATVVGLLSAFGVIGRFIVG